MVSLEGFRAPLVFLDAELYWHEAWHTRVYSKPNDVHAYLPYDSAHAKHVVRNIPSIVSTRLRKLCSEDHEYVVASVRYKLYLTRAGYPKSLLNKRSSCFGNSNRKRLLKKRFKLVNKRVVCAYPSHPGLPNARDIFRRLHPIPPCQPSDTLTFP